MTKQTLIRKLEYFIEADAQGMRWHRKKAQEATLRAYREFHEEMARIDEIVAERMKMVLDWVKQLA